MLKNITKLECQIGDKIYQLLCEMDSPLTHVKEALFQFQKYVGQIEDQARDSQEKVEEKVQEEVQQEEILQEA